MAILASEAWPRENKKIPVKIFYPPPTVSIEPMALWFQIQHSSFWTDLAFTCKTEILGSFYSHALLILTKSSLKIKWCMNRGLKISYVVSPECLNLESEI